MALEAVAVDSVVEEVTQEVTAVAVATVVVVATVVNLVAVSLAVRKQWHQIPLPISPLAVVNEVPRSMCAT